MLRDLAGRGLVVGIGSNFDGRLLGLVDAFPELVPARGRCVISSLVRWRKPAPEFFAALTAAAGVRPPKSCTSATTPATTCRGRPRPVSGPSCSTRERSRVDRTESADCET